MAGENQLPIVVLSHMYHGTYAHMHACIHTHHFLLGVVEHACPASTWQAGGENLKSKASLGYRSKTIFLAKKRGADFFLALLG